MMNYVHIKNIIVVANDNVEINSDPAAKQTLTRVGNLYNQLIVQRDSPSAPALPAYPENWRGIPYTSFRLQSACCSFYTHFFGAVIRPGKNLYGAEVSGT